MSRPPIVFQRTYVTSATADLRKTYIRDTVVVDPTGAGTGDVPLLLPKIGTAYAPVGLRVTIVKPSNATHAVAITPDPLDAVSSDVPIAFPDFGGPGDANSSALPASQPSSVTLEATDMSLTASPQPNPSGGTPTTPGAWLAIGSGDPAEMQFTATMLQQITPGHPGSGANQLNEPTVRIKGSHVGIASFRLGGFSYADLLSGTYVHVGTGVGGIGAQPGSAVLRDPQVTGNGAGDIDLAFASQLNTELPPTNNLYVECFSFDGITVLQSKDYGATPFTALTPVTGTSVGGASDSDLDRPWLESFGVQTILLSVWSSNGMSVTRSDSFGTDLAKISTLLTTETTIAPASDGVMLPLAGGDLNVASNATFPTDYFPGPFALEGIIFVTTDMGVQPVTFTGVNLARTKFTGCNGGVGTMSTGGKVSGGNWQWDSFWNRQGNSAQSRLQIDKLNTADAAPGQFWVYFAIGAPASGPDGLGPVTTIFFYRSKDGGNSWLPATIVVNLPGKDMLGTGSDFSIAPDGSIWFTYSDMADVWVTKSTNHGVTWSTPQKVSTNTSFARLPKIIATDKGNGVGFFGKTGPTESGDWSFFYTSSNKAGNQWSTPVSVNGVVTTGTVRTDDGTNDRTVLDFVGLDVDENGWTQTVFGADGTGIFTEVDADMQTPGHGAIGDTSVLVFPTEVDLPAGTQIGFFFSGTFATLTAPAPAGTTDLTIAKLQKAVDDFDFALIGFPSFFYAIQTSGQRLGSTNY